MHYARKQNNRRHNNKMHNLKVQDTVNREESKMQVFLVRLCWQSNGELQVRSRLWHRSTCSALTLICSDTSLRCSSAKALTQRSLSLAKSPLYLSLPQFSEQRAVSAKDRASAEQEKVGAAVNALGRGATTSEAEQSRVSAEQQRVTQCSTMQGSRTTIKSMQVEQRQCLLHQDHGSGARKSCWQARIWQLLARVISGNVFLVRLCWQSNGELQVRSQLWQRHDAVSAELWKQNNRVNNKVHTRFGSLRAQ